MLDRRKQLGGSLPKRVVRAKNLQLPGDDIYKELKQGSGKNSIATTMAVGPAAQGLDEGPRDREAHRADRAGRVPHVRHGRDVPEREGLQPGRTAVRIGRPQYVALLQGVGAGPDAPRGHLRGRRDGVRDGRGLDVLHARRAHDPVLHLLLDVRVPAHRRLDLGDGRPARARLPDRRHRRPHHADRRGPAARRRPLAAARGDQPGGRALRPGVRLRGQPHHADRPRADVRRERRGRDLLPHRLQRAGPARPRSRTTSTSRASSRASTTSRRPRARARGSSCSPRASASRGSRRRSEMLAEEWGVQADTWSVTSWNELARDAVAAEEWNLLHPGESPRTAYVTDRLAGAPGPVVAVSDYMRAVPLQIARGCPRTTACSVPTASASPTPARRRAGYFHIDAAVRGRADAPGARRRRPDRAGEGRRGVRRSTGSTTRPRSPTSSRRAATRDRRVAATRLNRRQVEECFPDRRVTDRPATCPYRQASRVIRAACQDACPACGRAGPDVAAGLEQGAEADPAVHRRLGRPDELVDDLREPLRVVLVREVPGVRDHLDPGAAARARPRCWRGGPGSPGRRVPTRPHIGIVLGEVGAVGHRDDLAAPVDDGPDDVPDRVPGVPGP